MRVAGSLPPARSNSCERQFGFRGENLHFVSFKHLGVRAFLITPGLMWYIPFQKATLSPSIMSSQGCSTRSDYSSQARVFGERKVQHLSDRAAQFTWVHGAFIYRRVMKCCENNPSVKTMTQVHFYTAASWFRCSKRSFCCSLKSIGMYPIKKKQKKNVCSVKKADGSLRDIFPVTFFSYERDYVSKLGAEPGGLQKKLAPRSCSLPEKFQSNHDRSVIITAVISVCDFITVSLYIHCRADLWRWESARKNKYNLAHGLIIRVALLFSNIKDSYGLQTASWFCKYIFN